MKLRKFWEKYRNYILAIGIFSFFIHGAKLNSGIIGIDTEDLIHLQKDFYTGWAETGRYGLVFLKQLFQNLQFQPYFAGLMTVLFLAIGVFAFVWLWSEIGGRRHWSLILGAFLWISHPIITEQFYFSLQSMEICVGILLTTAALYLTKCFGEKKKWYLFVGSVAILLITFSMYQVFVPFYIYGTTTILLLQALEIKAEEKTEGNAGTKAETNATRKVAGNAGANAATSVVTSSADKRLLKNLLPYVTVFFTAFLGNTLITNLCFPKSEYLGKQILWGSVPFVENIVAIGGHVFKTLTGYEVVHYHFSYGILVLLALILVIGHILQKQPKGAVTVFYLVAVLVAPYLLVIVCGGGTVIRSQLILPAATAFLVYLNGVLLEERWHAFHDREKQQWTKQQLGTEKQGRMGKQLQKSDGYKGMLRKTTTFCLLCCFVVAAVTGAWKQTYTTMALYYTDACRYEQDAALGRDLIERIEGVRGETDYPVVVIGSKAFDANHSNVLGETIGKSMFDYDVEVEPEYFWSTKRILGFIHTLGKEYPQAAPERMEEAYAYSEGMPQWPAQGCVQVINDMVVVKLEVE